MIDPYERPLIQALEQLMREAECSADDLVRAAQELKRLMAEREEKNPSGRTRHRGGSR